ncbi:hypothetical protein [Streptomyces nigrescens]|uniref:hypothetical protein n=1 Tax=Streptomyces nigrescens TaxID=1920 RepID=UPI00348EEEBE
MSEHELSPGAPARPADARRTAGTVMKGVLVVAAVAAAILLLYMVFFIGIFVMAGSR